MIQVIITHFTQFLDFFSDYYNNNGSIWSLCDLLWTPMALCDLLWAPTAPYDPLWSLWSPMIPMVPCDPRLVPYGSLKSLSCDLQDQQKNDFIESTHQSPNTHPVQGYSCIGVVSHKSGASSHLMWHWSVLLLRTKGWSLLRILFHRKHPPVSKHKGEPWGIPA